MPIGTRTLTTLFLTLFCLYENDDRLMRLSGSTFSLELVEPAGWRLATRAAPQIANFILHPEGQDWRRAESVIYVRIVPREKDETAQEFLESSDERFRERCPFADGEGRQAVLQEVPGFLVREFLCPGVRDEIVALREVPGAFVVFTLSTGPGGMVEKSALALEKILVSFRWREKVAR
jgi:hypothetical protein